MSEAGNQEILDPHLRHGKRPLTYVIRFLECGHTATSTKKRFETPTKTL